MKRYRNKSSTWVNSIRGTVGREDMDSPQAVITDKQLRQVM